jgi:hypothetical protein
MVQIPLLNTDIMCMYGKDKELILAWFVTEKHSPVCKAIERYVLDIPWIIDGIICNTAWALDSINTFVTSHQLYNAGMVCSLANPYVQESIIRSNVSEEIEDDAFTVQSRVIISTSCENEAIWYHATVPPQNLLQYQLFFCRTGLYVLSCTTSSWALCATARFCFPHEFDQILQSQSNLEEVKKMFNELSWQSPLMRHCTKLRTLSTEEGLVMFSLYVTGRSLYEAI